MYAITGFDEDGNPIWEDDGTEIDVGEGGSSAGGGDVTEITNTAQPGQEGYGWRYFSDGTVISPTGQYYKGNETSAPSLIYDPNKMTGSDLITRIASGTITTKDLTNYLKQNPTQVAGIVGGLAGALSNATPNIQRVGYQGEIPKYTAVRQAVNYAPDVNRRPGSGGRSYFSDTQYVKTADAPALAAAKEAATQQAQGIAAAYQPAAATTNPYASGVNQMKRPWEAAAPAATTAAPAAASSITSTLKPEDMMAKYAEKPVTMAHGGIAALARGRYLQGSSDGMADKLPASIDGKEPAKLSHGEFVVPADVVSHLGNGNSDAGAKKLYQMMDKIRMARTGSKKQGKQINPNKFMPGGAVGYAAGGNVKGYDGTTGSLVDTTKPTYESNLSNWAGPEVTDMLARGKAVSSTPYQAYTGPLTAGASDLQQQAFAGMSDIAKGGYTPTTFTGGTFDLNAANQYMNPYLSAALDPQLKEMQRQSDIARLADAGRLTKAGAYGGGRQAIMESEGRRNLLDKQMQAIGSGYQTAYDKAMQQFNADQQRRMEADKASEASRQYSADFGLKTIKDLADLGATQRTIESEGIAADKAQFEEQRDYDKNMVKYMQSLFSGLPLATQGTSTATPNTLQSSAAAADTVIQYLTKLGVIKP